MKIVWHNAAWEEFTMWNEIDPKTFKKIVRLIKQCARTPYEGDGKPEPLKHDLAGYWSRRINSKDRIVYCTSDDTLEIISCKTHYGHN